MSVYLNLEAEVKQCSSHFFTKLPHGVTAYLIHCSRQGVITGELANSKMLHTTANSISTTQGEDQGRRSHFALNSCSCVVPRTAPLQTERDPNHLASAWTGSSIHKLIVEAWPFQQLRSKTPFPHSCCYLAAPKYCLTCTLK